LGKCGDSKNNHEDTKNTKFSMNQLSIFLRVFVVKNAYIVPLRYAASYDQRFANTGRSASSTAFPRNAWEREKCFSSCLRGEKCF